MAERKQLYKNFDTAPRVYVNSVQMAQSQFDVRMSMGTVLAADDAEVVTDVNIVVYMTIQHAKAFSDLLLQNIARYEAVNGPIQQPKLPTSSDEQEAAH